MDFDFATPQEVFDAGVAMPADVVRAHFLVDDLHTKYRKEIMSEGKFPPAFFDDLEAAAKEHGFEYVHPKYVKGLSAVSARPTMH